MVNFASGVNPKILQWARERAGLKLKDIASKLGKNIEDIQKWETGASSPTYVQLEKLAYTIYKRPIALFFFPEPPEEQDPKQEFRTLPDFEIENLHSDTRYAIRQAQAMQSALHELNDGVNPVAKKIFRDIKATANSPLNALTQNVRDYLGISLSTQITWKKSEDALKNWRSIIQDKGIYIFKRSFKQESISGFSLLEKEFPVIYINNSTAKTRQIFTIFHELAHILLHISGMTKSDDQFLNSLEGISKNIEIYSNQFAAEFLIPSVDFNKQIHQGPYTDEYIQDLASRYCVSRESILRRLLDRNLINQTFYEEKANEWITQYQLMKKKKSGGDYYATQATYLGDKYIDLAFSKYYQGKFDQNQLADYFNMKASHIPNLEHFAFDKGSA